MNTSTNRHRGLAVLGAGAAMALAACNGLIALDGYHTCSDTPTECDAGDASPDGSDGSNASDATDAAPTACNTSAQCGASAPVCSAGKCAKPIKLAPGNSTFSCVILSDGNMMCWGQNNGGQLGRGDYIPSASPVLVPSFGDVRDVRLGFATTCAVKSSGSAWCWGENGLGLVGQGGSGFKTPTLVALPNKVTSLAMGNANSGVACALLDDGSVYCWGNNVPGATGVVGPTSLPVTGGKATEIHANGWAACARSGTSIECWGDNGIAAFGQPPDGGTHAINDLLSIDELSFGEVHQCVRAGGNVRCWGLDDCGKASNGAVACGTYPVIPSPKAVSLSGSVAKVSASNLDTCVVFAGNGRVQCWGANGHGTRGDGTKGPPDNVGPGSDVMIGPSKPLEGVVDVAVHRQFVCALTGAGAVYCWGENVGGFALGPSAGTVDGVIAVPVPFP